MSGIALQVREKVKGLHLRDGAWLALLFLGVSCAVWFVFVGYAAGYGAMRADGQVTFERRSLWYNMKADYRRDGGEWSFGYLVPFLVGGLAYLKRTMLFPVVGSPALKSGIVVLVIASFFYWAGYRGEQKYIGYAAGQLLILGWILIFFGWGFFRKVFWLWALMGMMWPWRFLIGRISAPLQLIMVKMTSGFMSLFGVGAATRGSALITDSKDPVTNEFISMDIDVACSGMRSLFALIMIGLAFAFLRVNDEWKRWFLMIMVPVVAILGNFVRVLLLYGGSLIFGTEVAIGEGHNMSPYHLFAGLMVFVVALVFMEGLVSLLEKKKMFSKGKKVVRTISVNNSN